MGDRLTEALNRIEQPDVCGLCPRALNRVANRSERLASLARDAVELLGENRAVTVVEVIADSIYD